MSENWKPSCALETLKQRATLLAKIREYFANENVLEVETPILSSAGNTDTTIDSFTSQSINSDYPKSYLRTSPEFPLKRLLCSGVGDVFEIGKVFRKGEIGKSHNSEFTMLEWYRVNFNYHELIHDVRKLFESLFYFFQLPIPDSITITFQQCFERYLSLDLLKISNRQLNKICQSKDYNGSQLSNDEALDYLFATQVQPKFDKNKLTFVTLYPSSQAALAQINPKDENTSLRFEVFSQGHELGNGYQELIDSDELLQRFAEDNKHRGSNNHIQVDNNLIAAMNHGMPNCSGIAVGVDRLLMVLLNTKLISDVLSFEACSS